jgi:hypothetical protein
MMCHAKIDSISLSLFFPANFRRSIELVLLIKHTHELIEAQWMKCLCVCDETEYEGRRRIKLTQCARVIKRESLREWMDEELHKKTRERERERKFHSHQ